MLWSSSLSKFLQPLIGSSGALIFPSATCSLLPLAYEPPLISGTKFFFSFLIGIVGGGGGVKLGPLGTAATNRPIVPAPGDCDDGEIGGMMIGTGNRSTRRKPAPVPLWPPQTPQAARMRTRAAAVGSQRLTAWATARPGTKVYINTKLQKLYLGFNVFRKQRRREKWCKLNGSKHWLNVLLFTSSWIEFCFVTFFPNMWILPHF
jgi:hypothetical protein